MANINNILTGLLIPGQIPLDPKLYCASEIILANLGASNNLAFTYYNGMIVYCVAEKTRWEWREVVGIETGLMLSHFTYPPGLIVFGIDYSSKVYNFFEITFNITPTDQNNFVRNLPIELIDIGEVNPQDITKQMICDYVLSLPAGSRTILDTDSKWNILIQETADSNTIIYNIYEIINKGKGIISTLLVDNLLSINDRSINVGLEDVITFNNTITTLHAIIMSGSGGLIFTASVENAGSLFIKGTAADIGNASMEVGISDADGFPKTALGFYSNRTTFTDALLKGIEYTGNYEANFTPKSLITQQYHAANTVHAKTYLALLNQVGTDAPTAQVLYNNTGLTFTFGRVDLGAYTVTSSGPIPISPVKVVPRITPGYCDGVNGIQYNNDGSTFQINTRALSTNPAINGLQQDLLLYNDVLEITILN